MLAYKLNYEAELDLDVLLMYTTIYLLSTKWNIRMAQWLVTQLLRCAEGPRFAHGWARCHSLGVDFAWIMAILYRP